MKDFNDNNGEDIKDISIEEIEELYKDVIEMPEPLIATVCGHPKILSNSHR